MDKSNRGSEEVEACVGAGAYCFFGRFFSSVRIKELFKLDDRSSDHHCLSKNISCFFRRTKGARFVLVFKIRLEFRWKNLSKLAGCLQKKQKRNQTCKNKNS